MLKINEGLTTCERKGSVSSLDIEYTCSSISMVSLHWSITINDQPPPVYSDSMEWDLVNPHFFNPLPHNPNVRWVITLHTSHSTYQKKQFVPSLTSSITAARVSVLLFTRLFLDTWYRYPCCVFFIVITRIRTPKAPLSHLNSSVFVSAIFP